MNKYISGYIKSYTNLPKVSLFIIPFLFFDSFLTSVCLNISLYFSKVKGISPSSFAEFISLYYVGSLIGAYAAGYLSLRFLPVSISCFSSILTGTLFILLIENDGLKYIPIIMLLLGVSTNSLSTSNYANLLRTASGDTKIRSQLINIEMVIFNVCFSISAFFLLRLGAGNIDKIILYTSIVLVILGSLTPQLRHISVFSKNYAFKKNVKTDWNQIPISNLAGILMTVIIVGLIFSSIKVIYAPTIEHRFGDSSLSAIVASINPWIILIFQPLFMLSRKTPMFLGVGGLIIGVGYYAFGNVNSLILSVTSLMLLTIGEMIYSPMSKELVVSCFKKGEEGYALGLWRTVFLGSGFVGPLIAGNLADYYGVSAIWQFCGIMGVVCLLVSFVLEIAERQSKKSNKEVLVNVNKV